MRASNHAKEREGVTVKWLTRKLKKKVRKQNVNVIPELRKAKSILSRLCDVRRIGEKVIMVAKYPEVKKKNHVSRLKLTNRTTLSFSEVAVQDNCGVVSSFRLFRSFRSFFSSFFTDRRRITQYQYARKPLTINFLLHDLRRKKVFLSVIRAKEEVL